jgi:hypothetical protein
MPRTNYRYRARGASARYFRIVLRKVYRRLLRTETNVLRFKDIGVEIMFQSRSDTLVPVEKGIINRPLLANTKH